MFLELQQHQQCLDYGFHILIFVFLLLFDLKQNCIHCFTLEVHSFHLLQVFFLLILAVKVEVLSFFWLLLLAVFVWLGVFWFIFVLRVLCGLFLWVFFTSPAKKKKKNLCNFCFVLYCLFQNCTLILGRFFCSCLEPFFSVVVHEQANVSEVFGIVKKNNQTTQNFPRAKVKNI